MTSKKKLIIAALIAIAISSITGYGIYVRNRGIVAVQAGSVVRQLQVGFVRSYAAIILLGALAVLGYFIYYGLKLVG